MSTQQDLDLGRSERNAENVDQQLETKAVAAMQRAVVWLLIAHRDVKIVEGLRALTITQRAAAVWCRDNARPCRGMKCDHTAILRALQTWIDRGVIAVRGDTWWLSPDRLRKWFESVPGKDDLPIFAPVVTSGDERCALVTSGDERCALVTSGDERCALVTSGDVPHSFMSDGLIDEGVSYLEKEKPIPQSLNHSPESGTTPQQASPDVTTAIAALPDLPLGVWDKTRSDSNLFSLLTAWWSEHCLHERLGELSTPVSQLLFGLVQVSREKNNPDGYFAHARERPRSYLIRVGKEWLARVERARNYAPR